MGNVFIQIRFAEILFWYRISSSPSEVMEFLEGLPALANLLMIEMYSACYLFG